jgi:hypothetical protein
MNKNDYTVKEFLKGNFITVIGFAFTILNLWLTSNLSGIKTQIALHDQRIKTIEVLSTQFISVEQINNLDKRLERIENKLDNLLESH